MEKIIWELWKDTILKDNGVPGYYWIKGFADIVKEKGDKVNEVRTRIREKELREKMGNIQEEKKISVEKINDDDDNYYDNDIQGNELSIIIILMIIMMMNC